MHRARPFLSLASLLLLTWGLPCSVVAPCQEQKLTHSAHLNLKRFGYTSFEAAQSDVSLRINEKPRFNIVENPDHTYSTTSFGQYKFKAEKEGMNPMYGLIPLKFNGGYLATDFFLIINLI